MATTLAARRATELLRYLARHPNQLLTLSDLAERLDVSPGAMHGVLGVLIDAGFVEDDGEKRYRLGPEALVLGAAARAEDDEIARAACAVAEFARRHGVATTMVARRGDELVVVDGAGPRVEIEEASWPGTSFALTPPNGGAFLAWSPPHEVLSWLDRGGIDPTGPDSERLRDELAEIRETGCAVRNETGVTMIAAPIVADDQPPALALVAILGEHCPDPEMVSRVSDALVLAARAVATGTTAP